MTIHIGGPGMTPEEGERVVARLIARMGGRMIDEREVRELARLQEDMADHLHDEMHDALTTDDDWCPHRE